MKRDRSDRSLFYLYVQQDSAMMVPKMNQINAQPVPKKKAAITRFNRLRISAARLAWQAASTS